MTICALGKCGGRELGFASDIELMFVYSGSGETAGPKTIASAEYYDRLVREVVRAIRARREGIFEIDLQLRPYGAAGSLAAPLESFRRYFAAGGPAWGYERQALIKLRPIAGDAGLGEQVAALRDEYVYSHGGFDVVAMRAMRERQLRHLVTAGAINAKFSQGGLVDVEYIVQGLQMLHGGRDPSLRLTNTREAMAALAQAGLISAENYARLREAHAFLRRLIDALRMARGNAKDLTVPPEESEDFAFLARRLGYGDDPLRLRADLTEHLTWVQRLGGRLLG
jgi:glutamate-ammonia-ligase adenylyltransferase